MKFFGVSLLFGIVEVLFTALLIRLAARNKKGLAALVFLLKTVTYVGAVWLLVFKHLSKFTNCISGFAVGAAVSAVLLLLYFGIFKRIED